MQGQFCLFRKAKYAVVQCCSLGLFGSVCYRTCMSAPTRTFRQERSYLTRNVCIPSVSLLGSACMHVPQHVSRRWQAWLDMHQLECHAQNHLTLRQCTPLKLFTMLKPCLACPSGLDQAADMTSKHCLACTKRSPQHGRHICLLQASCTSAAMSMECSQACGGYVWTAWVRNKSCPLAYKAWWQRAAQLHRHCRACSRGELTVFAAP